MLCRGGADYAIQKATFAVGFLTLTDFLILKVVLIQRSTPAACTTFFVWRLPISVWVSARLDMSLRVAKPRTAGKGE
ncbi:MAG: hypothetical protein ACI9BH_002102 [Paracoccaceae bacterium]|jgi:hypothetical protein